MDRKDVKEKHRKAVSRLDYRETLSRKMKEYLADPNYYFKYLLRRKQYKGVKVDDAWVERKFKERFPNHDLPLDNHKIISIKEVGYEEVFDMEVERYHNFATNGIFVHNSKEDQQGHPFVGDSGELLRKLLLKCGVDMRADCVITNSLVCRPIRNEITDPKQIEFCRPNVLDTIRKHEPTVIIALGKYAVKSIIGHYFKEDTKGIMRWAGFQIPNHSPNCWICPTVHPAFVLRERDRQGCYKDEGLRERWLLKHLKAAVELSSRKPWKGDPPDYLSQVQVITDLKDAAGMIRRMSGGDRPVSWDIETTCLKPQGKYAKIVCASLSDGRETFAFPWLGEAVDAMKEFLVSPVPKISHNQRFENGWAEVHLNVKVRNWLWDSMAQAHVLDGRPGIAGLKYQAFVNLGQPDYDSHLTSYLRSRKRGGNEPNMVKRVDFKSLASYCGADSLLTWKIAKLQTETLRREFR